MKNLMTLLMAASLLAACGNQTSSTHPSEEGDEPNSAEKTIQEKNNQKQKEKETEDKTNREDSKETDDNSKTNTQAETNERAKPEYVLNDVYSVVPIDDAEAKVVLLTIDDAPDKYALEMAKTLKKLDAPAIFFVNGHFITTPEKEKILKEIYDMGFEIGNHTYSHNDLTTLSPEKQKEEILSVNDKVEEITGERPKFFRAPFGKNTDVSRQIAKDEKMELMNWSFGYDWNEEYMSKEKIADIMVNTNLLANGANLLMHDREWTNAALEEIVKGLRGKGYETVNPHLIQTPRNEE
ncbi:polysaccharide deacetylase family protein [Lederbergia sp. NSJ-179]|uniref:polysaccharide deacetylase family protein n=1 Tax=Lederbergia sp. NSJ-179 TaxID=2931402 RepID=UPI001FD15CD6|nr:polysaccharide deacetylase family protein [Lederbergia sp. NSJ-179]MCJ7843277.1 polysaccharide deacetylase family protein [Lederbergia sp. NSJ-179]